MLDHALELEQIHGHIFRLITSGKMQAYEYRDGPVINFSGVDPTFFQKLIKYLQTKDLTNLLALQVLNEGLPDKMCGFVLKDNGTVMIDERDVKDWTPHCITGFFFEQTRHN